MDDFILERNTRNDGTPKAFESLTDSSQFIENYKNDPITGIMTGNVKQFSMSCGWKSVTK